MTKSDERLQLTFERKVFRIICGAVVENGDVRRQYNFDLEQR